MPKQLLKASCAFFVIDIRLHTPLVLCPNSHMDVLAGEFSMPPRGPIRWVISSGLDLTAGGPRAVPSTSLKTSQWEQSLYCPNAPPLKVQTHWRTHRDMLLHYFTVSLGLIACFCSVFCPVCLSMYLFTEQHRVHKL